MNFKAALPILLSFAAFSKPTLAANPVSGTAKAQNASASVQKPANSPSNTAKPKECLLFSSRMRGHLVLNRMDSDGGNRVFLSHTEGFEPALSKNVDGDDWCPVLSPDGKLVAFFSNRDGAANLWLMNSDGQNLRQLTDSKLSITSKENQVHGQIRFSPNSKQIAFVRDGNIWLHDLSTELQTSLTSDGQVDCLDWLPDGKSLVFIRNRSLYLVKITSPIIRLLVANQINAPLLQVDKAGKQVLYFQNGAWLVQIDNKNAKRIVTSLILPNCLHFSPDGGSLCLLAESPDHLPEVFTCSLDGKATQVTEGGAEDCFFSLDGKRLYFLRQGGLWVIGTDGKGVKPLIHSRVFCPEIGNILLEQ